MTVRNLNHAPPKGLAPAQAVCGAVPAGVCPGAPARFGGAFRSQGMRGHAGAGLGRNGGDIARLTGRGDGWKVMDRAEGPGVRAQSA